MLITILVISSSILFKKLAGCKGMREKNLLQEEKESWLLFKFNIKDPKIKLWHLIDHSWILGQRSLKDKYTQCQTSISNLNIQIWNKHLDRLNEPRKTYPLYVVQIKLCHRQLLLNCYLTYFTRKYALTLLVQRLGVEPAVLTFTLSLQTIKLKWISLHS